MSIKDTAGNRFASKKFNWKNFKGRTFKLVKHWKSPFSLGAGNWEGKLLPGAAVTEGGSFCHTLRAKAEDWGINTWVSFSSHPLIFCYCLPLVELKLKPDSKKKAEIGLGGVAKRITSIVLVTSLYFLNCPFTTCNCFLIYLSGSFLQIFPSNLWNLELGCKGLENFCPKPRAEIK